MVKVIVPCYGYAQFLEGCLDSVLDQVGVDLRVLIIDDCSPDETAAVAERIVGRDDRVTFRRHAENKGLIGTANEGLEWAADGDYVVLLSADDLLTPGSLERSVSVLESNPNVGMVYGQAPYFETGRPLPEYDDEWRGTRVIRGRDWIRRRCRAAKNCVASPEVVVRASVQNRVGPYDSAHPYTSDLDMWLRVATVADLAFVKGAAQALYRSHGDSMSRTVTSGADGVMADFRERRSVFEDFLAGPGARVEGAAVLRATLGRTLARQALRRASEAYDRDEVDPAVIDDLVKFAAESHPAPGRLPEWWGLRARRLIGAGRCGWFPPFLVTRATHRVRGHLEWRRRCRQGG